MDVTTFDYQSLKGKEFRRYYANVLVRAEEVARSTIAAYRPTSSSMTIEYAFVRDPMFNAMASLKDGHAKIYLSASIPILLRILFDKLCSFEQVLPLLPLPTGIPNQEHYTTTFMLKPSERAKLTQFDVLLSNERAEASRILADMCVMFIVLHELGHVLCGHLGASTRYFSNDSLAELASHREREGRGQRLRQYWEYQADAIASGLLPQFIDHVVKNATQYQPWVLQLSEISDHQQEIVCHLTALTNAAITVLFLYMNECRMKLNQTSNHPHPVVRAFYVKDMVARSVADRWNLDPQKIGELQYGYIEPFLFALNQIGLDVLTGWTDPFLDDVERRVLTLKHAGKRLAGVTRPWSWLPVEEWGASPPEAP